VDEWHGFGVMKVEHAIAPSYRHLRPYKPETSAGFPVYPDLCDRLVDTRNCPDDALRFVMAVCSSYAYGDASTVAMITARLGLARNRCLMISEFVDALFLTSTAYLIQSRDGRAAILCYRGTPPTSLITWLTDFEVEPVKLAVPVPSGQVDYDVHAGFYRNVRSTRYEVLNALRAAIAGEPVAPGGDKPEHGLEALYITGHSLGGASAAMLAAMLVTDAQHYHDVLERLRAVYTFGAPMIGSPEFASACDADPILGRRVVRYVYANDIVPQLPPTESGRFAHYGREYRYTPAGASGAWAPSSPRKQVNNLIEVITTPLSVVARTLKITRNIPFHASLNDHLPQYYIDALTPTDKHSEFGD
jgi:Lipase (class 3)